MYRLLLITLLLTSCERIDYKTVTCKNGLAYEVFDEVEAYRYDDEPITDDYIISQFEQLQLENTGQKWSCHVE